MPESQPDDKVIKFATKLFGLAREGGTEQLAAYVDAGVDPNLANHKGDSLVMLAAYHGHGATVAALVERGADPNRPNDRGQTPLAGAVFKDEPEVITALVAGGADPQAGQPSAVATAQMFERPDLLALMRADERRAPPACDSRAAFGLAGGGRPASPLRHNRSPGR